MVHCVLCTALYVHTLSALGASAGPALALLDDLSASCSPSPLFPRSLWRTLLRSRDCRRPAALYLALRMPNETISPAAESWLPEKEQIVCAALCHALADETALTVRAVLDLLVAKFPLHACPLPRHALLSVMQAALGAMLVNLFLSVSVSIDFMVLRGACKERRRSGA